MATARFFADIIRNRDPENFGDLDDNQVITELNRWQRSRGWYSDREMDDFIRRSETLDELLANLVRNIPNEQ